MVNSLKWKAGTCKILHISQVSNEKLGHAKSCTSARSEMKSWDMQNPAHQPGLKWKAGTCKILHISQVSNEKLGHAKSCTSARSQMKSWDMQNPAHQPGLKWKDGTCKILHISQVSNEKMGHAKSCTSARSEMKRWDMQNPACQPGLKWKDRSHKVLHVTPHKTLLRLFFPPTWMEMHSREEVDDIKLVLGQRCWLVGLEFLQELPLLGANNEPVCYVPVLQVGQCNLEAKVTIILHTPHHTTPHHTHTTHKSHYTWSCV